MPTPKSKRAQSPVEGDFFRIDLGEGLLAHGRILKSPICAFYDAIGDRALDSAELVKKPILFKICVMKDAFKTLPWKIIGHAELEALLQRRVWFSKMDSISGELTLYSSWQGKTDEKPATVSQCQKHERAAVWSACHVESRLRDHYAGVPNRTVENFKKYT